MMVSDLPARRPSLAGLVEAHPAMRLVLTSGMTQTRIALMNSCANGAINLGMSCRKGRELRLHAYPRKVPRRRAIKTRSGDFMLYSYSGLPSAVFGLDRSAETNRIARADRFG